VTESKRGVPLPRREVAVRTYFVFQAEGSPDLRGFTDDPGGAKLPKEDGPWRLVQAIAPDEDWTPDVSRAVVSAGILENGFYLLGPIDRPATSHPIIASDRVEGTPVYGSSGNQIGTIRRLLIEKVSGHILYVDVTFGGFLGIGVHHHTIPWGKLAYDRELEGYRTDVADELIQGAPAFTGEDPVSSDRKREAEIQEYWRAHPGQ
jgi:PRC-barrel domain